MKEISVADLEVGDIYYYWNSYEVVTAILRTCIRAKCIMSPTNRSIGIGTCHYINKECIVDLLVRDNKIV